MSGEDMMIQEIEEDIIYEEEDEITDDKIQKGTTSPHKEILINNNNNGDVYVDDDDVVNDFCEDIITNDLLSHVLIINENVSESNGHVFETYLCQQCDIEYPNKDKFIEAHSDNTEAFDNDDNDNGNDGATVIPFDAQPFEVIDNVEDVMKNDKQNLMMMEEVIHNENVVADYGELKFDNNDGELESSSQIDHYFCCDCQQVFKDIISAQQHTCLKVSTGDEAKLIKTNCNKNENTVDINYKCYYCQQDFAHNDDLITHMEECEFKNEKENDKEKENDIIELDSEMYINVFHCDICSQDFTTLRAFSIHKRTHKKSIINSMETSTLTTTPAVGPTITCNICKTEFSSSKNLKLHMKMHNKPEIKSIQDALPAAAQDQYNDMDQFYCEICKKSFDRNLLAVHRNMHQNITVYNCSKCNRKFDNLASYQMHLQMHLEISRKNEQTSKKNINDSNSQNSNTQQQQQQGQHNNIVYSDSNAGGHKKFPCQFCGREFRRPYEKVKHERIHTGERPYECEVCGKSFRVPYSLTLHLRTHTDIRPYICTLCNKRYKSHSVYVHHMKTHNNERSYKCDMCSKSFRTSVQLCGHKNSHKKPFICTECKRPFASLYALKVHMKTHEKEKEKQKQKEKFHKSNINVKNDCSICGATFGRTFALRCHLKQKHGIQLTKSQRTQNQNKEYNGNNANYNCNDDQNNEPNYATFVIYENVHDNITTDHSNSDVHFDETTAATQSILNAEDEITESLPSEDIIITDWLTE